MALSGRRFLTGCAIGCGSLLVAAIVGGAIFMYWATRPGELTRSERLIGPDTAGYVVWTLRLEDPGTAEFANRLFDAAQPDPGELEKQGLGALGGIIAMVHRRNRDKNLEQLFPMAVAWTLSPGATPDEDLHLINVSLEHVGNRLIVLDWILRRMFSDASGVAVRGHGDESIYDFATGDDERFAMFLRSGQIFITSDLATAETAVDRLDRPAATEEGAPLLAARVDAAPPLALRGALINARGELERLWDRLGPAAVADLPVGWSAVRAVTVSGGFADDRRLGVRFDVDCAASGCAGSGLAEMLAGLAASWRETRPRFTLESTASATGLTAELTIDDPARLLVELGERHQRH